MITATLLLTVILAAGPRISEVITLKTSDHPNYTGSIQRSTSIPTDIKTFTSEEEILSSISSATEKVFICSLSMTSVTQLNQEKHYNSGYLCEGPKQKDSYYGNLDSNPPLEIRATVTRQIKAFSAKFDLGNVGVWGIDNSLY